MKWFLFVFVLLFGCMSAKTSPPPTSFTPVKVEKIEKRTPLHTKWAEFSVQSNWSYDFAEDVEDSIQFATNDPDGKVLILVLNNGEWNDNIGEFVKVAIAKAFQAGGTVDGLTKTKLSGTDAIVLLIAKGQLKVKYVAAVKNQTLHVILCTSPKKDDNEFMLNECDKFINSYKMK